MRPHWEGSLRKFRGTGHTDSDQSLMGRFWKSDGASLLSLSLFLFFFFFFLLCLSFLFSFCLSFFSLVVVVVCVVLLVILLFSSSSFKTNNIKFLAVVKTLYLLIILYYVTEFRSANVPSPSSPHTPSNHTPPPFLFHFLEERVSRAGTVWTLAPLLKLRWAIWKKTKRQWRGVGPEYKPCSSS